MNLSSQSLGILISLILLGGTQTVLAEPSQSIPVNIKAFAGETFPLMPVDMVGIPESDKDFLQKLFALILESANERLALTNAISVGQNVSIEPYLTRTRALKLRLSQLDATQTQIQLRDDLPAILDIQMNVLSRAIANKQSLSELIKSTELTDASQRTAGFWNLIQSHYSAMSPQVKNAMEKYLAILDMRQIKR